MASKPTWGTKGVLVALGIAASCGKLYSNANGTLGEDGVFRSNDGGVIFGPGTACADYDAAAAVTSLDNPAACNKNDGGAETCLEWASTVLPKASFGYAKRPLDLGIQCDDPRCSTRMALSAPVECEMTSEGDRYCSAFFQQFISTSGVTASAHCAFSRNDLPSMRCAFDCPQLCRTPVEVCVRRGSGSPHCETICTP